MSASQETIPTRFVRRIARAALLDPEIYEEVEADRGALVQAGTVVLLASLGIGIGSFENGGWSGLFWTTGVMLVSWVLWALASCGIGVGLLATPETESDPGELLRTIGFASAPGMLGLLGVIPGANPWVLVVVLLWMLAALVVAIRQALDYCSTGRAILVCALASPLVVLPLVGVLLMTGPWPI